MPMRDAIARRPRAIVEFRGHQISTPCRVRQVMRRPANHTRPIYPRSWSKNNENKSFASGASLASGSRRVSKIGSNQLANHPETVQTAAEMTHRSRRRTGGRIDQPRQLDQNGAYRIYLYLLLRTDQAGIHHRPDRQNILKKRK